MSDNKKYVYAIWYYDDYGNSLFAISDEYIRAVKMKKRFDLEVDAEDSWIERIELNTKHKKFL